MLAAAAVVPCPPLLVPEVAAGAAPELAGLRTACADAIQVLAAARPDRLVVVGPAAEPQCGAYPAGSAGSFRAFGLDLTVLLGEPGPRADGEPAAAVLPPSLAVAAWLLERAGWDAAPVEGLGVAASLAPQECLRTGREVAASARRVALLVAGDGSARRDLKAPGYLDERAGAFDAAVAAALDRADHAALAALDADRAEDLLARGRAPWQVLAGAADGAGLGGTLLHDEAPYGVGYFTAVWS